jgi:hypothetical protein
MELLQLIEDIDPNLKKDDPHYKKLVKTVKFLEGKKNILFLTTSNRGEWAIKEFKEEPKSTILAKAIQSYLGKDKCTLLDVSKLNIFPCEGNVSHMDGNSCGIKKAKLEDKEKNPTGHHRCWRSINNKTDELWKISKVLFESDTVVFFGSVRWGQMNSYYQKLIERLTWLENRHTTYKESNLLKDISCGIIATGQNWNGKEIIKTQKEVLTFFGFDVKDELCWNWQYTQDKYDETQQSYKKSGKDFNKTFELE